MVDLEVYKFRPQGIEMGNQCGHHKLNFRKGGFKSYLWNQEKKPFFNLGFDDDQLAWNWVETDKL